MMAIVQLRNDTEGRAYYRPKLASGRTPMEAMRAPKRRLSDIVYGQLVNHQNLRHVAPMTAQEDKLGLPAPARPTPTPTSTLR